MKARQKEVAAAEAIVDAELTEFRQWAKGLNINPTVVALRAKTRGVLVAELERTLGSRLKHLGEADRAALMQMVESATNKLLHAPTTRLRASAGASDGNDLVRAAKHLFDLPEAQAESEEEKTGGSTAPPPEPSEKRLPH
jgi:glutamyl-tRNA reductase